jgi:hypothetical protein
MTVILIRTLLKNLYVDAHKPQQDCGKHIVLQIKFLFLIAEVPAVLGGLYVGLFIL